MATNDNQVVNLPLTRAEAWALLRATILAAESDRTAREDVSRLGWVRERLGKLLDANYFGVLLRTPDNGTRG